jgi:hypothetical protein
MIGVVKQTGVFVQKNSLRFLKGDPMLCFVGSSLPAIPGKFDIAHSIILALSDLAGVEHDSGAV